MKLPSEFLTPSETTIEQWSYLLTHSLTRIKKFLVFNGISGKRIICGESPSFSAAKPPAAAIQPACLPITSKMNTLVEVSDIEATSIPASRMETATYFATEPNPGQLSVQGRSLSMVLGMPIQVIG